MNKPIVQNEQFTITTFYKLVTINDCENLQVKLIKKCKDLNIKGTILIADEGLNATLTGKQPDINKFYHFILSISEFANLEFKESYSYYMPFNKLKVKIKEEVIKFNMPRTKANEVGTHLSPSQWEDVITKDNIMLIDTRNDYEIAFGTFKSAINPNIRNFTDLASWIDQHLNEVDKDKPIAMFCTGGIRCEKSTAYVKQKGFKKVYHLKGGILNYLKETKNQKELWQGKCFVFDDRIAVDPQLTPLKL